MYNLIPRAVRYDDIYRMDEIKSLSFHITVHSINEYTPSNT